MKIPAKVHFSAALLVAFVTVAALVFLFVYLRAHPEARQRARLWGFGLLALALLCLLGGLAFVYSEGDSLFLGLVTIASFYACPLFFCTGAYLFHAGSRPE